MEIKAQDIRYSSEKDIVVRVYEKAVDIVYFETNRFNTSKRGMNYEDSDTFYKELVRLRGDIRKYIDKSSLYITERTRRKLIEFTLELGNSQGGLEAINGRWTRLNPLHYKARILFLDCEQINEAKRAEFIKTLEDDIKGNVEPEYCFVQDTGDRACWNTGFHKDSTIEDLKERGSGLPFDEATIAKVITDENPYGNLPYDEHYRYQYVKTIIAVFREDFPEFFPE